MVELNDRESAVLRILMEVLCLLPPSSRSNVIKSFCEIAPDMAEEPEEAGDVSDKATASPKERSGSLVERAVDILRKHPQGMPAAQLMRQLGVPRRATFAAAMARGKQAGLIVSEGHTRWTRYRAAN